MFEPKFTIDATALPYSLEEIERINFRVERMLLMPKHEQWLRREAFVRTAYSSTMVENVKIPEHEMEEAAKASPIGALPKQRLDVTNYGKALEFADFISDDDGIRIDEAVIRQIHWFLMKGIHDTHLKPGQYRTGPNWIGDQGAKIYESPFHVDVPILMREFSDWLATDEEISPLLKAGIAHVHLVAIHPFVDGNGRTARLLATLFLQRHGYGFRRLLSLDAYYQRNRDDYMEALRECLGPSFRNDYDSTSWLEFFTTSVILQSRALERRLTDWRMGVDQIHKDWGDMGLAERQIDGLIYTVKIGYITRKDYAEIANISVLTASRDLVDMVKRGLLRAEGAGRNRKYRLRKSEEPEENQQQARLL